MNWVQLGGSIAAILMLAGVARMLRLGESRIGSTAAARRFAEEALAGFESHDAIVGTDGNAARSGWKRGTRDAQASRRARSRRGGCCRRCRLLRRPRA